MQVRQRTQDAQAELDGLSAQLTRLRTANIEALAKERQHRDDMKAIMEERLDAAKKAAATAHAEVADVRKSMTAQLDDAERRVQQADAHRATVRGRCNLLEPSLMH